MSGEKKVRALRGATTVAADEPAQILDATRELLEILMRENGLRSDDVISAIFTLTPDLRSTFPARAAREMGWRDVPLLCTVELDVPGSLPRCIRVLLHAETTASRADLTPVYLREARELRPDLIG